MSRKIGKCGACKQVSAVDYDARVPGFIGKGIYRRETTFSARVNANGRTIKATDDIQCPRCGEHRWNGQFIEGFVTEHVCDARCTEAKGFKCECACGGKNHGQGYVLTCEAA